MLVSVVLCMMQIKIREMQFCVLLKGKKLESSLKTFAGFCVRKEQTQKSRARSDKRLIMHKCVGYNPKRVKEPIQSARGTS